MEDKPEDELDKSLVRHLNCFIRSVKDQKTCRLRLRFGSTPTRLQIPVVTRWTEMSIVYKELINSTIQKLSSSNKRSKRPLVLVNINGHAFLDILMCDTGADMCCMTAAIF